MDKFAAFNDFDKQLIIYSKGWYKETNVMDDIRSLIAKLCGLLPEHVPNKEVLEQVAITVHRVWTIEPANLWDMESLYRDVWVNVWTRKETITMVDQVNSLLRVLHNRMTDVLPPLPRPSTEFFPLVDDDALNRWDKNNA